MQAAAAGQQIWVFVGPGLAVCREEAAVSVGWGQGVSRKREEALRSEVGRLGPGPGEGPKAGSGAHTQRRGPPQGSQGGKAGPRGRGEGRGSSPARLEVSGMHRAHGFCAPRAWRAAPAGTGPGEWRGSPPKRPSADTSFGACRTRASGSSFTSMTRSDISISLSGLAAGAGSTRRGALPALRRDMSREPGGRAGGLAGGGRAGRARSERGAQVSGCRDPLRTFTRAGQAETPPTGGRGLAERTGRPRRGPGGR